MIELTEIIGPLLNARVLFGESLNMLSYLLKGLRYLIEKLAGSIGPCYTHRDIGWLYLIALVSLDSKLTLVRLKFWVLRRLVIAILLADGENI